MYDADEKARENNTSSAPAVNEEAAHSFASFVQMLEDGQLHADLSTALRDLNAEMNDYASAYGKSAKGKLVVTFNFTLEKAIFTIRGKFDVTKPEAPRDASVAWSTPGNNFTPQNPKQMNLFGKPRDVTSEDSKNIRSI